MKQEKKEGKIQTGKRECKSGNRQSLGMCIGMSVAVLIGYLINGELNVTYLCCGMLLGMAIGSYFYGTISNADIGYLEELRVESYEMEDYLSESYYIDWSEEGVVQKVGELVEPIHQKYRDEYADYVEGLEFFWEKYGSLVMKSDKELKEVRQKWEMGHPHIFAGKKKKFAEKYWMKVEEIFPVWQEEVAKALYEYVRDEIVQIFDYEEYEEVVPVVASEVLKKGTATCDGKANLLAAMLRCAKIPAGMCFQHLTKAENDAEGYILHAFNAIYLDTEWVFVDARGNKEGIDAQFDVEEAKLAYVCRDEYDEYFIDGIYYAPSEEAMNCIQNATNISEVYDTLPEDETSLISRLMETNR